MGRNRSFNEAEVIALAGATFRANGYDATSMDDPVAATGLHRGSLYGAFGSEGALFIRALTVADASDPTSDAALDLILVGLLEIAPTDDEVREIARRRFASLPRGEVATTLGSRLVERAGIVPSPTPPERNSS